MTLEAWRQSRVVRGVILVAALATAGAAAVRSAQPVRVLVVTGGHGYPTSFYTLFEQHDLVWDHATSNEEAFKGDLRAKYDVVVLYDMSQTLSDAGRKHFQAFVESGKGLVVLHHAVVSYHDWPWYHELIGAHYWERPRGKTPASTYKHDEYVDVREMGAHPITATVAPVRLFDETYKGMWLSPRIRVLLTTDNPTSDGPLAWIAPHARSRIVTVQLGHSAETHRHVAYRTLVRNAILWSVGRLPDREKLSADGFSIEAIPAAAVLESSRPDPETLFP
jgi:type 1 glutamine amidotransferase